MWKDDQFISFDDPKSIKTKLDFLKKKHLGGAVIWTIDTDDFRGKCSSQNFTITSTIMKELNNS
jgi:GH18 family chitinase